MINLRRIFYHCLLIGPVTGGFVISTPIEIAFGQESIDDSSKDKAISPRQLAEQVDFTNDILPILKKSCFPCHGPARQESNFRLDIKTRALGNGDYGEPPIIPGDSSNSSLIHYVTGDDPDLTMPPEGASEQLADAQIELLRQWIDQGATWPEQSGDELQAEITTDHWAFQPLKNIEIPNADGKTQTAFSLKNEIDCFIAQKLNEHQIEASPPADRVSLIRRIYLDMHGLQPEPDQVQRFVDDPLENAIDKIIDDVLKSHHYGERWARHWLDVVRFGESTGYEVNRDRANAFYFRDYVIDSLNDDKSFRDFIVEQLAGDAVGVDEATGFLVGGPYDIVKSPDANLTLMQRQDELADYVNTTSTTFLGLTVGCARCHNHKFDPILQRDYYALQAVFAGVEHGERQLTNRAEPKLLDSLEDAKKQLAMLELELASLRSTAPNDSANQSASLLPPVNAKTNTESFEAVETKFVRFTIHKTNQFEPCIDELEIYSADGTNIALSSLGGLATSSGNYEGDPKHRLEHVNDGKFGNPFSWIANAEKSWIQIELGQLSEINRIVWGRDREERFSDRLPIDYSIRVSLDGKTWSEIANSSRRQFFLIDGKEPEDAFIARLPEDKAAIAQHTWENIIQLREEITKLVQSIPVGYVGTFKSPPVIHRLYRGDPMSPREEVPPDTLSVMGKLEMALDESEQSRRLKLARWIASDDNPLTARVIVNRVWHYHFGQGIVSTPSDFGKNGAEPTHPELLDWLAKRFIEHGWSLKWLHREILSSSTYQQSSRPRADAIARDADCRLLWRFPPRRLEAEAIRDCILQLTGKLNPKAGGPGFLLFRIDRENVHHYFPLEKFEAEHFRRMIYMTKIRQEQDDVFGAFDCPDGGQTIPDRSRSTTALQALNLLNSKFMLEQGKFLAERLRSSDDDNVGDNVAHQINRAYQLAFLRDPTPDELEDAVHFVEQHGLEAFCRALLNANEFLFVS